VIVPVSTFSTDLRQVGNIDVVNVVGEVDAGTVGELASVLAEMATDSLGVVVDISQVTLLDAAAIGVLVGARRSADTRGIPWVVAGARGLVLETLEVTGVAKALGVYDGLDQALPAVAAAVREDTPGRPNGYPADRVQQAAEDAHQLLAEAARLPPADPRRTWLRQQAVEAALPYARRLARRYHNRGEPYEDLAQAAALGLVRAVNGYEPDRGTGFLRYAVPTILGELRRHFRDNGWRVHVPRRLQDLRLRINAATALLPQALGRAPSNADLATYLGISEDEVNEALEAARSYRPISLSAPLGHDDGELGDLLGAGDPDLEGVVDHESIRPLFAQLPEREQRIVAMRFFGNMAQTEIADQLGISQMHVSRLLAAAIAKLRRGLLEDEA
jgi:RNA polymerase sigma-B factor